jgi:hypothetical protein
MAHQYIASTSPYYHNHGDKVGLLMNRQCPLDVHTKYLFE